MISIQIQSSTALSVSTVTIDVLHVIDMQSIAQFAKELNLHSQTQTQVTSLETTLHGVNAYNPVLYHPMSISPKVGMAQLRT
jgi:hypothetical protein